MIIHILDTNLIPQKGDAVKTNCQTDLIFYFSIGVDLYGDGRVCGECLQVHVKGGSRNFCIAFYGFESDAEANDFFAKTGLNGRARLGPNQQDPTKPVSATLSPPVRIGSPAVRREIAK